MYFWTEEGSGLLLILIKANAFLGIVTCFGIGIWCGWELLRHATMQLRKPTCYLPEICLLLALDFGLLSVVVCMYYFGFIVFCVWLIGYQLVKHKSDSV